MSLNDILKSIEESRDQQIAKIKKQQEEALDKIKAEYANKIDERKTELLRGIQIEADRKVSQAKFEAQAIINNRVLAKKQAVIKEIYSKALQKLSALSADQLQQLLVKLIKELPQVEQGEIIPAQNSVEYVQKAAATAGTNYPVNNQTIAAENGFVFKAEGLEIDNTLQAVINNLKEQTETEVANILF